MSSDETTPVDPEIRRMVAKIGAEHQKILSSIGTVTTYWGMLEGNLCDLFTALNNQGNEEVSGVVFYAPSNTETRLGFIERLIIYHFEFRSGSPDIDSNIVAAWRNILGKINTLKNTRNAIAHGIMSSSAISLKNQTARLTPAFADVLRFLPNLLKKQHPGLGSAEIETHIKAIGRVNDRVRTLASIVRCHLREPAGLDQVAIQELRELAPQQSSETSGQSDPDDTQPAPQTSPESSPE